MAPDMIDFTRPDLLAAFSLGMLFDLLLEWAWMRKGNG